jgi:predicted nucleic acid-binding protein
MLLDTDVLVDILRNHPPALVWLTSLGNAPIALPGLVAMELVQGCRNLSEQQQVEALLRRCTLHWPSSADCLRALKRFHDQPSQPQSWFAGRVDRRNGRWARSFARDL